MLYKQESKLKMIVIQHIQAKLGPSKGIKLQQTS
jgi:hypothetical protein